MSDIDKAMEYAAEAADLRSRATTLTTLAAEITGNVQDLHDVSHRKRAGLTLARKFAESADALVESAVEYEMWAEDYLARANGIAS